MTCNLEHILTLQIYICLYRILAFQHGIYSESTKEPAEKGGAAECNLWNWCACSIFDEWINSDGDLIAIDFQI